MRARSIILSLCVLFLGAVGASAKTYDLVATGDHSVWVITNEVKSMFERDTGISLDLIPELAIVGKGCGKGIIHARRGRPDREFGLICCAMDDADVAKLGLVIYPIAKEPLAIIVNPANPVSNLTREQVRGIFSGKIVNWSQVGGRNEKIAVITELHCRDYTPNWKMILDSPDKFTDRRVDVKAQPEMAKTVADFKQAIGHLEMTSVRESREKVKVLSVDGYEPTSENVEKGLYTLIAPLAVATHGKAEGKVVTFIEYMRTSAKVKDAMRKFGVSQTR